MDAVSPSKLDNNSQSELNDHTDINSLVDVGAAAGLRAYLDSDSELSELVGSNAPSVEEGDDVLYGDTYNGETASNNDGDAYGSDSEISDVAAEELDSDHSRKPVNNSGDYSISKPAPQTEPVSYLILTLRSSSNCDSTSSK
jgi:hypothetical protein